MNAVIVPNHPVEARTMTGDEQSGLELQLGKLQSDVQHIQSDVSDLKVDLRGTNQRIDDLRKETQAASNELRHSIDELKNCLISSNRWTIGLYIGLASGLLLVIARGLKWL